VTVNRDAHVVLTAYVREPYESDDLGPGFMYEPDYAEIIDSRGNRVNAVVDLCDGRLVPFMDYVDWYGDGGTQPGEVPLILLYEAMKLGAARATATQ
jgi:hypothetical protein